MHCIDENIVLDFYIDQINQDNIMFLQERDQFKADIIDQINALKVAEEMHDKIQVAKKLWKLLFESAMSYIDPSKEGYDELFSYFDEYVNFEELIFASDSFYRDHTIHCLWVYFLGEYIYRKPEFSFLFENFHEFEKPHIKLKSIIEKENLTEFFDLAYYVATSICERVKFDDSVRCISSLTHDLGYPIKKIGKINKSISKILPYFTIYDFDEFNFSFSEIQKNFIDSFLDILSISLWYTTFVQSNPFMDFPMEEQIAAQRFLDQLKRHNFKFSSEYGITKEYIDTLNKTEQEILKKAMTPRASLKKNTEVYLRYCKDFEEWSHGIMSAFLLTKTLRAFSNIKYYQSNDKFVTPYDIDMEDYSPKSEILCAISDHTSSGYKISSINTVSELLTIVDELEEFSRISRANQNRQYISEFCKTELYCENNTLNINFIFDNTDIPDLDPEKAFKGRCKRFLTLFDVRDLDENLNIVLRCIGKLPYDDNVYALEIRKKYAIITINGEEQNIPRYLKSNQFYTKEEYTEMK